MNECRRCRVTGRVQGVWFRGSAREQALALGLTGRAVNLPDSSVEVIACGAPAALDELCAWLHTGPPAAQVQDVICERIDWQEYAGFDTR